MRRAVALEALSAEALEALIDGSAVVEKDLRGPKVLLLADGRYLKFFRRKRYFNRELLRPAAVRFARHVRRLAHLGVPVPRVTGVYRLAESLKTAVVYQPLPGRTLRQCLAGGGVTPARWHQVGVFVAMLHQHGVYFRSLHTGNIVVDGDTLGLIDVLDLRLRPWPLTRLERERNWRHFLSCPKSRPYLVPENVEPLLAGYRAGAALSPRQAVRLEAVVARALAQPPRWPSNTPRPSESNPASRAP